MFTVEKKFRFEAAHMLPMHDGKCAKLHGHSFNGSLFVASYSVQESGPQSGMVVDFYYLKQAIKELVDDRLDHAYLNDIPGFEYPTSELIAKRLFYEFVAWFEANGLLSLGIGVQGVKIHETCTSSATFSL